MASRTEPDEPIQHDDIASMDRQNDMAKPLASETSTADRF
jgi:hypothetical protein